MSINFSTTSSSVNYKQYDPQQALQQYIKNNNCDEATAKAALEKTYGAPTQQNGSTSGTQSVSGNELNGSTNGIVSYNTGSNSKEDFDNQLIELGIPKNIVETHDQEQIKSYADQNNITLPDPPKQGQNLDFSA